jgi:hypothetical protein
MTFVLYQFFQVIYSKKWSTAIRRAGLDGIEWGLKVSKTDKHISIDMTVVIIASFTKMVLKPIKNLCLT